MILVVGATGQLGSRVCSQLLADGYAVRAATRERSRASELARAGAEVVIADLRDASTLDAAVESCDTVIDCAHGLAGDHATRDNNPRSVDDAGNANLIAAAKRAGVARFIFVSLLGASADSPTAFLRAKYASEERVRKSAIPYTIIRPGAFMETWAGMIGSPVIEGKKATVFGDGTNPVSFVAVETLPASSSRRPRPTRCAIAQSTWAGPRRTRFRRWPSSSAARPTSPPRSRRCRFR